MMERTVKVAEHSLCAVNGSSREGAGFLNRTNKHGGKKFSSLFLSVVETQYFY